MVLSAEELNMPQHVKVEEYNPAWPEIYRKEKQLITTILGRSCIAVYHIGSTAVPGLAAKPIIDIMLSVRNLEEADNTAEEFRKAGYEWLGEYGISGRRYLRKGGDERTHQIHIFQANDRTNIERHLAFRNFLRTHKEAREKYAVLKKELAVRFPYDIESYCSGKDELVKSFEREAMLSYNASWDRLFTAAAMARNERNVSPFIEAGAVSAALMTDRGNIYCGVCIDTACSLGMCAERNAVGSMITAGENHISKIAVVMSDGSLGSPCGACREMLMQLGCHDIEILKDHEAETSGRLFTDTEKENWWGKQEFNK